MRYVAAYCLASLDSGVASEKDIEKILGSVGIDYDAGSAKKVVSELKSKKVKAVIAEGNKKLRSVPTGGGGAPAAGGGAAKASGAPAAAPPPKEEKKEEPEEESDEDMGFGLFD